MLYFSLFIYSLFFSHAQELETIQVQDSREAFFHLSNPAQESFNKKQLDDRSLFDSEDLWNQMANVNTASGTNRIRYFKIRGIGERSEYDTIPSNSVGFFYDHIDLSGLSGVVAFYDVEKVEVLKGPQTFLFGDSALGGNVLITSSESFENEGSFWGGQGSQNQRALGAKSTLALNETFSIKLGVQKNESNGFFYNPNLQDHTAGRDELFANFGWIKEFGNSLLKVSHIFGENKNGNDIWNTDGSFTVLSDNPGNDDQTTHGHSLELTGPLSPDTHYLLIGSYSHSDQVVSYDEDWNSNDYWNTVPGWNRDYDFFRSYNRRKINLHLKSILQHRWKNWDFSYGLHYYQKEEETDVNSFRDSALRSTLIADFVSDKIALLTNINYKLTYKSRINLSNRVEQQEIKYFDTNGFQSLKSNTPFAFNLLYAFESGSNYWRALVSRGFKGAGFNPEINLTPEQQQYNPEHAMNYELGWKYQGQSFTNNLSVFYMERRDHQITTSSQDNPTDPSQFTFFVDNAAKSHHYGLEWQAQWKATTGLSFYSSLGLMKAEFVEYQLRNESYNGRELAHTPSYTFSLGTDIFFASKIRLNMNTTGRDQFFYSNSHGEKSKPYSIFNASLHWQGLKSLQLSIWGRNLFNKRYSQRGFYFGNDPPSFNNRLYEQNAPPLELGLRAEYWFL